MDKFLAALRDLLKSDDAAQQTLFNDMYAAAEAQFAKDKDSKAADVFAAMQKVIDAHKEATFKPIVDENRNEAMRISDTFSKPEGRVARTQDIAVAGLDKLTAAVEALNGALTSAKTQAIANAASAAGLTKEGEQLGFNLSYPATVITNIHHDQQVVDVKGHGTAQTERRADKGKLRKGGEFKHSDNIQGGEYSKFVVRGDLFQNDTLEYDTLEQIAEAWLNKFNTKEGYTLPALDYNFKKSAKADPEAAHDDAVKLLPAGSGAANYRKNIQAVTRWMAHANELPPAPGKYCDKTTFEGFVIKVGDELATPKGEPIAPKQTTYVCKTCTVNNRPDPKDVSLGYVVTVTPNKPTTPIVPPKEEPNPDLDDVHTTTRLPTASAQKGKINAYTTSWYSELYAMSNMEVAKNHYALKNVAANKRAHGELQTSETENFRKQGDWARSNVFSREDDYADKKRTMNGKNWFGDDKARPFTNGYVTDVNDDNSMNVKDGTVVRFIGHGRYAFTDFGITVDMGTLPLASPIPAVYNPSKQLSLFSKTERYGLSQGQFVMSEVNLGGRDNIFADQRSWISNAMESPDNIGAMMFLDYNKEYFAKKLKEVEDKTGAERTAAATEVLKSFRDIKDNPIVRMADARAATTMAENEKALEGFLSGQMKVDVASIKKDINDLDKNPRILPEVLSEAQQKELAGMPAISPGSISGMKVEKVKGLYKVAADHIYYTQNKVQHEVAQGIANDLTETQAAEKARETWKLILRKEDGSVNVEAVRAYGEQFALRGQGFGVEAGHAASDLLKNPQNYNLKRDEAKKLVLDVFGDSEEGKKALKDVEHVGKSRGSAWIPLSSVLTRDGAFAVTDEKALEAAFAKTAQERPEVFAKFIETISDAEPGKTDGRPHAIAMLNRLGSQRNYSGPKNEEAAGLKAVRATLGEEASKVVHDNVRDLVAYTESGASGFSVTAREQSDNIVRAAALKFKKGQDIDLGDLYKELTATESRKQFLAESLKTRPHMAADVVLGTILRDPEALKDLEKGLKDYGKKLSNGLEEYHKLRNVIKRTIDAAEDYKKSGNVDDLVEATEKFAIYFHKLEARAASKHDGKNINADQRANAWDGLMTIIGDSPTMSSALLETIGSNEKLRNAFLQGAPETAAILNMVHGRVPTHVQAQSTMKDEYYAGSLFTLPTDSDGKVIRGGLFNRKHATANKEEILEVVGGNASLTGNVEQNVDGAHITNQLSDKGKAELDQLMSNQKLMNQIKAAKVLNLTPTFYLGNSQELETLKKTDLKAYNNAISDRLLPQAREMLENNKLFNMESGTPVPFSDAEVKAAALKLIEGGYLKVTDKAGDLVATPHQKAYDRLCEDLGNMNQQPGLDRKLALLFVRLPKSGAEEIIPQLPPGWGQCPTCPPPGRGG